jgi:hypothetical protein
MTAGVGLQKDLRSIILSNSGFFDEFSGVPTAGAVRRNRSVAQIAFRGCLVVDVGGMNKWKLDNQKLRGYVSSTAYQLER